MAEATVGQVVTFHPKEKDLFPNIEQAAIVAKVNEDGTVNLMVIDPNGGTYGKTFVRLGGEKAKTEAKQTPAEKEAERRRLESERQRNEPN